VQAFLKQSTASQVRAVGPFIDDTDFTTTETGLSIANTDVKLSANGGASANKNSGGGTHIANGMYALTFDATDTATVGELSGSISVSGALVVPFKFTVLEESVYDALFGSGATGYSTFDASSDEVTTDSESRTASRATSVTVSDKTGFSLAADQSAVTIGTVNAISGTISTLDALDAAQDTQHGATRTDIGNLNDLSTSDVDARLAAFNWSGITISAVSGAVGSVTGAVGSVTGTVGGIAGTITTLDALDSAQDTQHGLTRTDIGNIDVGDLSVSGIADAVWDEAKSGHVAAGSFGAFFSGIASLASWLGIIAGKTADASTLAEVNATTAGNSYDNTRDSPEALRDRGDAAWTTGSVSGNVTITPLAAGVEQRVSGTTISLYTEEVKATTISISDADGDAVDLSGLTLQLAIEDHAGSDVQVIADGSITRSGASSENATFTNSAAVTATERVLRWSLRDITTGNEVLARGNIVVTNAGAED